MVIKFWQSPSGRSPVEQFIAAQDDKAAQRIMKDIDHFEEQGLNLLHTKKMKPLQGYKQLYELKTTFRGMGYRILLAIIKGDAWMLEGFKKKGDATRKQYIETAEQRRATIG